MSATADTSTFLQDTAWKIVENLPVRPPSTRLGQWFDSNASRRGNFQRTVDAYLKWLYALDVSQFSDVNFQEAEQTTKLVLDGLNMYARVQRLTHEDHRCYKATRQQLRVALEGLQAGLAPDPAKRPSRDQLLDEFAALLDTHPINLPGQKDCAPVNTP